MQNKNEKQTRNCQRSEWSISPNAVSQNQQSLARTNEENKQTERKRNYTWKSLNCCPSMPGLARGLLLGVVVGCLLLIIALALWLTKASRTTTTTTITSNTAITTRNIAATTVNSATTTPNTSATTVNSATTIPNTSATTPNITVTTVNSATTTPNTTATTIPNTTITTANAVNTTVTYAPVGIYALTIPTCATWNQSAIIVAGNQNGVAGSDLASLNNPVSIFVDNNDTLFISDRDNYRIVKYYPNSISGVICAGNNTPGSDSHLLNEPKGVAVDQSGAVIIADSSNYRIQQFSVGSLVGITMISNTSASPLGQMRDLHIDVNNNIYVTDSDYSRVVKYTPYSSIGIVLVGGNGSGSATDQLYNPYGNFMDGTNILYVADSGNHRITKYLSGSRNGVVVAGVTGSSGSTLDRLNFPTAVIVDNNEYIYVVDSDNNRIVQWTTNYTLGGTCIVGCSGGAGTGANQLNSPRDVKFDKYGNLYVSDQGNERVQKFLINTACSTSG